MTSVQQYARKNDALSKTKVKIYNPDSDPFTVNYHGKPQTIFAQEIDEFPHDIAHHIVKHLANHLLYKRGVRAGSNDRIDLEEIKKEIYV